MSQDDEKPDFAELMRDWSAEDFRRIIQIYGKFSSSAAKNFGGMLKPIIVKRGEKAVYSKQQKAGMSKSWSDLERLTQLRLVYLTMTLDMGMDQKIARSEIAKMYELSKSRVRDLVSVPKDKPAKK